jgi:hypothetical protein
LEFVEKAIVHTYDLLFEYDKTDDCRTLLDGSIEMILEIKDSMNSKIFGDTKK